MHCIAKKPTDVIPILVSEQENSQELKVALKLLFVSNALPRSLKIPIILFIFEFSNASLFHIFMNGAQNQHDLDISLNIIDYFFLELLCCVHLELELL